MTYKPVEKDGRAVEPAAKFAHIIKISFTPAEREAVRKLVEKGGYKSLGEYYRALLAKMKVSK